VSKKATHLIADKITAKVDAALADTVLKDDITIETDDDMVEGVAAIIEQHTTEQMNNLRAALLPLLKDASTALFREEYVKYWAPVSGRTFDKSLELMDLLGIRVNKDLIHTSEYSGAKVPGSGFWDSIPMTDELKQILMALQGPYKKSYRKMLEVRKYYSEKPLAKVNQLS
ncbi:hypothetical protein GP486_008750, partial [Trichoglossum hirsutum]